MNTNLHVIEKMDEALCNTRSDDSLLNMLTETVQELDAVIDRAYHNGRAGGRRCKGEELCRSGAKEKQRRSEDGMLSPAEDDKEDEGRGRSVDEEQAERECKKSVLRALRELSIFHSERVTAWRKACMFNKPPPEGSDQQQSSATGMRRHVADLNLPFREVKTLEKVKMCL